MLNSIIKRTRPKTHGISNTEVNHDNASTSTCFLPPQIIEEKMDIKGGFAKPTWRDVLWVQLVFLPATAWSWAYFYTRWLWKFGIKREEYGDEERLYVVRRNLGLSQLQFDQQYPSEEDVQDLLDRELWIYDNFKVRLAVTYYLVHQS